MGVYRRYRGNRRRVGFLIPTLIILCVLAAITLIYLNANLTVTEKGTELRLPFSEKTILIGGDKEKVEDVPLIIEEAQPSGLESKEEPDEYKTRIETSIFLPMDVVLDSDTLDTSLELLKDSSINTVVLEVKADDGKLAFKTSDPTAVEYNINQEDGTQLADALAKIKAAGLNAVAQISCFRDDLMPREAQTLACRSKKKVIWLDEDECTWLNPYSDSAREYIINVIEDVCEIGFSEILLTHLSFPMDGETSVIHYSKEESKQGAIKAFFDELSALAETNKDLRIAAVYDNYNNEESGQVLSDMVSSFYRIYTDVEIEAGTVSHEVSNLMSENISSDELATRFVPRIVLDNVEEGTDIAELVALATDGSYGYALCMPDGKYDSELFAQLSE